MIVRTRAHQSGQSPSDRVFLLGAGGLLLAAVLAYALPRVLYGDAAAYVHVRWDRSIDDAARGQLERQLGLVVPEQDEGTTWSYFLVDVSSDGVRRLVQHPAVEDTHYVDRSRFAISPETQRRFIGPGAAWVVPPLRLAALASGLGALFALLLARAGASRRRRLWTASNRFAVRAVTTTADLVQHAIGPWTAVFSIAFAAGFIRILETDPPLWTFLIREDGPVEDGTSLALAASSLLFAVAAYRRRDTKYRRAFCAVLAILLLVAALEEISWGQRIFGIDTPQFFLEHNAQQETNIHNTLQQWFPFSCPVCTDGLLLTKHVVIAGLMLYGLIVPALLHVPALTRFGLPGYLVYPPLFLSPAIVIGAVFMFDRLDPLFGNEEEVGELLLGVYLVLFGWHAATSRWCCRRMEVAAGQATEPAEASAP